MQRWIEQHNIDRYEELLGEETDPLVISQLQGLLSAARARLRALEAVDPALKSGK